MISQLTSLHLTGAGVSLPVLTEKPFQYAVTVFVFIMVVYAFRDSEDKPPRLNPKKPFEFTTRRLLAEYRLKGRELLTWARAKYGQKPYRLYSDFGDVVVLPAESMHEIRNNPALSFIESAAHDAHGYLPGFEPFAFKKETINMINKHLTKVLEWHEITAKGEIARLVSRMSTRIFMGEEMCRDEAWVSAVAEYSFLAFSVAGNELRSWPDFLRPVVHWFLPSCQKVRAALKAPRQILKPVIEKRRLLKAQALAEGKEPPVFDDAMTWFEKEYGPNHDPAVAQIQLSSVAIDSTSDLLQDTMQQIARHPEIVRPMRDEIIEILGKQGFQKTSLYNLKLMDSVIKEAQRLKPTLLGIRRRALADVELSDGFVIHRGQKIIVDTTNMWNSMFYEDPTRFDPYRFLRWRDDPDKEKLAHLVSTSTLHLGFGHGLHSCPGRFFAANEVKIALAHLLIKYDWKLPEDHDPQALNFGTVYIVNPELRLLVRRRQEEIDLDSLLKY